MFLFNTNAPIVPKLPVASCLIELLRLVPLFVYPCRHYPLRLQCNIYLLYCAVLCCIVLSRRLTYLTNRIEQFKQFKRETSSFTKTKQKLAFYISPVTLIICCVYIKYHYQKQKTCLYIVDKVRVEESNCVKRREKHCYKCTGLRLEIYCSQSKLRQSDERLPQQYRQNNWWNL